MGCSSSNENSPIAKTPSLMKADSKPISTQPTFKIVLLGDKAVGKSWYTQDRYSDTNPSTIGYAFISKDLTVEKEGSQSSMKLHIWDTAGEEAYKSMTKFFYRDSTMGLIVYDITSKNSYENVNTWIRDFKNQCPGVPLMIIGNKIDLEEKRAVPKLEVMKKAQEECYEYFECSAKTGKDVAQLFEKVAKKVYERSTGEKGNITIKASPAKKVGNN